MALPEICAGINMLGRLTIKAANTWLGYKRTKAMTYSVEAPYRNNKHFHNGLNSLENRTAVLAKATSIELHVLTTKINGHDKDMYTDEKSPACSDSDKSKMLENGNDTQQP